MSLVATIEKDLRSHLDVGQTPAPLTLSALAAHYEVSLTPIRTVVSQLIAEGLLSKQGNGRLQPTGQAAASKIPNASFELPNRQQDHYEMILREIVLSSLKDQDVFIREETTAGRHGLSRSAVRNIFHRIAGQGLLQHIPRRGWRIRSFSKDDLRNYSDAREALELKALDLAKERLLDADLQAMFEGNIESQSADDDPIIDNRLHAYFIEKSGNFYIQDFFERHSPFFHILFEWEGENREAANAAIAYHRQILGALLKRDWQEARQALVLHIRHSHTVLAPDAIGPPEGARS